MITYRPGSSTEAPFKRKYPTKRMRSTSLPGSGAETSLEAQNNAHTMAETAPGSSQHHDSGSVPPAVDDDEPHDDSTQQHQHQSHQQPGLDDDGHVSATAAAALVSLYSPHPGAEYLPDLLSEAPSSLETHTHPTHTYPLHTTEELSVEEESYEDMSDSDDGGGNPNMDQPYHVSSPTVMVPASPPHDHPFPTVAESQFATTEYFPPAVPPLPPGAFQPIFALPPFHLGPPGNVNVDPDDFPPFAHHAQMAQLEHQMPFAMTSNPHFNSLGSEYVNPGLYRFLTTWYDNIHGPRNAQTMLSMMAGIPEPQMPGTCAPRAPLVTEINEEISKKPRVVRYSDLRGDKLDLQGIDWENMGVSRHEARERRTLTFRNFISQHGHDFWQPSIPGVGIPSTESFFKFRRMDVRQDVHLSHFQLRNVLVCEGRSHAFYPGRDSIRHLNPLSGQSDVAVDLEDEDDVQVTTLDAKDGVLVAGTIEGQYLMRNIYAQDKTYIKGQISADNSGITNHLRLQESRTSRNPLVAFCSNDQGFRLMDVATQQLTLDTRYPFAINCSALSDDRRLRALVGDSHNVFISAADTGEILQELNGHTDYGFACDWSDDGWTVATAAQDRAIMIWDARRWTDSNGNGTPVSTVRTDMSGARSLRFSKVGSGPRVLVAAEDADVINVVDCKTYQRRQKIDIFGEIGGVSFVDGDKDLYVLCCDRHRGGLIQLERCNYGFRPGPDDMPFGASSMTGSSWARPRDVDWPSPVSVGDARLTVPGASQEQSFKKRRVHLPDLEPF